MDRANYQSLRFAVETEILDSTNRPELDQHAQVNNLMRIFLSALAEQEVNRQRSARKFKTFRRKPDAVAPSWAFREPGSRPNYDPVR